ncbi:MAG: PIN/TRAM domain-containing protein, partial [Opitutales bacterium]
FLGHALIVPRFVIDELQRVADSRESARRARGRRGLETLRALQEMPHLDLRLDESTLSNHASLDAKIVFLAESLKAKLLTTDFNQAQIAQVHAIEWLDISALAKALNPETGTGETLEIELVKRGKERHQAVGYLPDGSMVVVEDAASWIGNTVPVTVQSVLPSSVGKLVFASLREAT